MTVKPGQIYWALLEGPSRRPVIVVSREELNRGEYVVAIPFTSRHLETRRHLPNCVPFHEGQFGLSKTCVAQAEGIAQVSKDELDLAGGPIGEVDAEALRSVMQAVAYVLGAHYEPA
jgi:mRNA-degrading endonuclease toxin of MazEF toxin-antitoxin module